MCVCVCVCVLQEKREEYHRQQREKEEEELRKMKQAQREKASYYSKVEQKLTLILTYNRRRDRKLGMKKYVNLSWMRRESMYVGEAVIYFYYLTSRGL